MTALSLPAPTTKTDRGPCIITYLTSFRSRRSLGVSHRHKGRIPTTQPLLRQRCRQNRRLTGASGREINMETAVLRMILCKHRLWHLLAPDFRRGRHHPTEHCDSLFCWSLIHFATSSLPLCQLRKLRTSAALPKTLSTALHLADDEPLRLQQQGIAERRRTSSNSNGLQGLRGNGPQRAPISAGSNGFIAGSQISVPTS
jgi:hypothetical protein